MAAADRDERIKTLSRTLADIEKVSARVQL